MSKPVSIPDTPTPNEKLPATIPSEDALSFLAQRRSTPIKCLSSPGPSLQDVKALLKIASRVPDHRKLEPWRFIIIEGDARVQLGEELARIKQDECPDISDADLTMEKERFLRTPICVAVISSPDVNHKTPVWEQELSAGALCMNLLLAANAANWAGAWLTEWCAFSEAFNKVLNMSADEKIAGYIYLGTAIQQPPERPRPDLESKITYWTVN